MRKCDGGLSAAGKVIRALRELQGKSIVDVAEELDGSYWDVMKVEKGERRLPYSEVEAWADALSTSTMVITKKRLARELVKHYDPALYEIFYAVNFDSKAA